MAAPNLASKLALGLTLACATWLAQGAQTLEVIALRHATVDEVLPVLRPLLEPGGVLTGRSGQIIVRASEANIADLRRALEAIDRPARQLQILVRIGAGDRVESSAVQASGSVGSRQSRVEIAAAAGRSERDERVDQRIQVLEGRRAVITTGESRPLVERRRIRTPAGVLAEETVVLQEAQSGIEVTPRVSGDRVSLEVAQRREAFAPGTSTAGVAGQSLATFVQGRLGEWIELGSLAEEGQREGRGLTSRAGENVTRSRRIWVKVEELPR